MAIYSIPFTATTPSTAVDLVAVVAASTQKCIILGFDVTQLGTSDVGDAAEELIYLRIRSGQTVAGSGGAAATPVPTDCVSTAAAAARAADTTQAGTGTIIVHGVWGWNIRMPMSVVLTQEQQIILPASRRATFEMSAPADALGNVTGQLWIQEI